MPGAGRGRTSDLPARPRGRAVRRRVLFGVSGRRRRTAVAVRRRSFPTASLRFVPRRLSGPCGYSQTSAERRRAPPPSASPARRRPRRARRSRGRPPRSDPAPARTRRAPTSRKSTPARRCTSARRDSTRARTVPATRPRRRRYRRRRRRRRPRRPRRTSLPSFRHLRRERTTPRRRPRRSLPAADPRASPRPPGGAAR